MADSLRLQWTKTHTDPRDRAEDFLCHDGDQQVGRIYSHPKRESTVREWIWSTNGFLAEHRVLMSDRGRAETKSEAARAVEASYFATLERLKAKS